MAGGTSRGSALPITAITMAALTAVAFWSLKPIFISAIGDRADYAEVYVVSGAISVATSALGMLVLGKHTVALLRAGRRILRGVANASASGLFLALWYYGFYRALYGAAKVDATIIAFTWPLIAVVVMPLLAPATAPRLKLNQWLMVLASFAGAVAIGVANLGAEQAGAGTSGHEIVWAFVAAIGSGLYLPFAINAASCFERITDSKPVATFYSISVANVVALLAVLAALGVSGHTLRFYAFDAQVVGICALIGIGTYLVAEITWTWAFQEYKSLTLSSLPYFSPAVSVVLLHLIFDAPVSSVAVVGLVLILFSNLTLHARHRSTNALSLTLVATVYVALAAQVLPTDVLSSVPEMAAALTGLFAILAGFILARVAERRTQELDARATLVHRLVATDDSQDRDHADQLLQHLIELEFERSGEQKEERALAIRKQLAGPQVRSEQAREEALDAFNSWLAIHQDRLSIGEQAALWLTGLGSIVFVLLLRGSSPLGNAGSIVFAAGAFMAMFTIRDYDRNNIHGFKNQLWRVEQGFREIGKPYYVPAEILDSGELTTAQLRHGVRTEGPDGGIQLVESLPSNRTFSVFYLGTAALVILAVLVLPVTTTGAPGETTVAAPRPGQSQEIDGVGDAADAVLIADPGWTGASVTAEVLRATLVSAGVAAEVEEIDHSAAAADLIADDSHLGVHPDLWLENQPAAFQQAISAGQVHLNESPYTGRDGIYVLDPDGTAAVTDWSDLADPEVAAVFDSDGDGAGEVWAGPRGWVSTENVLTWLEGSGNDHLEAETYSETMLRARLQQQAEAGRPMLFYGYEPDIVHGRFAPRYLTPVPTTGGGTGTATVHVAWTEELAADSPLAAQILAAVDFDTDEVSELIAAVEDGGRSAEEVAQEWVSNHQERVQGWTDTRS